MRTFTRHFSCILLLLPSFALCLNGKQNFNQWLADTKPLQSASFFDSIHFYKFAEKATARPPLNSFDLLEKQRPYDTTKQTPEEKLISAHLVTNGIPFLYIDIKAKRNRSTAKLYPILFVSPSGQGKISALKNKIKNTIGISSSTYWTEINRLSADAMRDPVIGVITSSQEGIYHKFCFFNGQQFKYGLLGTKYSTDNLIDSGNTNPNDAEIFTQGMRFSNLIMYIGQTSKTGQFQLYNNLRWGLWTNGSSGHSIAQTKIDLNLTEKKKDTQKSNRQSVKQTKEFPVQLLERQIKPSNQRDHERRLIGTPNLRILRAWVYSSLSSYDVENTMPIKWYDQKEWLDAEVWIAESGKIGVRHSRRDREYEYTKIEPLNLGNLIFSLMQEKAGQQATLSKKVMTGAFEFAESFERPAMASNIENLIREYPVLLER